MASRDTELKIILTTVDRFSKNLDVISAKLSATTRATKATATGVQGLNNRMVAFTRGARNMVGGLIAIAVATQGMRRAIAATIGLAIDFESSFAGIRKTMDLTERQFSDLARANRELAKILPVNVNEINRLGELAGQFGIRGVENIVLFEKTIAGLGIATNLTADEAAIAMARIAAVTQLPISQIDNLASVVVELGNTFPTTEAEILTFAQRIAGTASALGFLPDQILAIGAAFTGVGVPAERGGTAVQKSLIAIQSAATGATDELANFTSILGITDERFKSLAANDPAALFILFVEALAASGDQAIRVLNSLDLADQRLLPSLLSLAGGGDVLRRALEAAGIEMKENTAATEEIGKRLDTTQSKITIAANNWADLGISVGQLATPALRDAATASVAVTDALSAMNSVIEVTNERLLALAIITGQPGVAAGQLSIKWGEGFRQLPDPVQDATIAIAGFIDQMVNGTITGLERLLQAVDDFLGKFRNFSKAINALTGANIPTSIDTSIGFRSNIAGGLRDALAAGFPAHLTGFQTPDRALRNAIETLPDFTFGELPDAASAAGKAVKEALTVIDALADGIIELSEAMELGLSVAEAAQLELAAGEIKQAEAAFRTNVEFEKLRRTLGPLGLLGQIDVFAFAMSELGEEFRRAGESVVQFVTRLAEAAQDALRTSFSELFARPTREQAEINLELAKLRRQRALLFAGGATADELKPLLTPLDAQIKALETLLSIRGEERNILQAQFDLADRTLLTDQQQLTELRLIRAAVEEFTAGLTARNTTAALALPQFVGGGGVASTNITVNVRAETASIDAITQEVARRTQDELRRASFGGSFIGGGTFVPG